MLPADYREQISQVAAERVEWLGEQGQAEEALEFGLAFQEQVLDSALLSYELGLIYNRLGKYRRALVHYGRAVSLDPLLPTARYDRGELLLASGDLEGARQDFEVAAQQAPDHWVVYFRLAELAAMEGDAPGFEAHLLNAMRYGIDLWIVADDPRWRTWAVDEELGHVLSKLLFLYGDERLLEFFEAGP